MDKAYHSYGIMASRKTVVYTGELKELVIKLTMLTCKWYYVCAEK